MPSDYLVALFWHRCTIHTGTAKSDSLIDQIQLSADWGSCIVSDVFSHTMALQWQKKAVLLLFINVSRPVQQQHAGYFQSTINQQLS